MITLYALMVIISLIFHPSSLTFHKSHFVDFSNLFTRFGHKLHAYLLLALEEFLGHGVGLVLEF